MKKVNWKRYELICQIFMRNWTANSQPKPSSIPFEHKNILLTARKIAAQSCLFLFFCFNLFKKLFQTLILSNQNIYFYQIVDFLWINAQKKTKNKKQKTNHKCSRQSSRFHTGSQPWTFGWWLDGPNIAHITPNISHWWSSISSQTGLASV